jgi:endonuclease YncB( thermonuclease family)
MRTQIFARIGVGLWLLVAGLVGAESWTGKVVGVSDGDTITVMRDGRGVKVRLHGIDCPESAQPWGARAKQMASVKCFSKEVTVHVRDTDRYGRTVGEVILGDGTNLNHQLVADGFAWWYRDYAKGDTALETLEAKARKSRAGLWSDAAPVAPWDWRRGVREGTPVGDGTAEASRRAIQQVEAANAAAAARAASQPALPAPIAGAALGQGVPQASQVPLSSTVWRTETGRKYHEEGCRFLAKSKLPIDLASTVRWNLEPCSVCNPPILDKAALAAPRRPNADSGPQPQRVPTGQWSATTLVAPPPAEVPVTQQQFIPESQPQVPSGVGEVYITNTGEKYHANGCRYLEKSRIPIGLADAQGRGYGPCSICRPGR